MCQANCSRSHSILLLLFFSENKVDIPCELSVRFFVSYKKKRVETEKRPDIITKHRQMHTQDFFLVYADKGDNS